MWGQIAAAVAPTVLSSLIGSKSKTQEQVPLETPEQAAARRKLMGFANTGTFGDFTAGADAGVGYGNYDMTAPEQSGMSSLQSLLSSGIPDQYRMGDAALQDLLATSPQQIEAQFQPVKDQVARSIRDSNTALKRNAGFAGNLYSTDTIRGLGDIEARGNETLTAQLANLTNDALNRRLQAIPLAYQSAQAQQQDQINRVQASQQFGSLTRNLNNAAVEERNAEILRRRQELQLPIQAAQTVAGQSSNYGVPSITTQQESPYQNVLNMASNIGGQYLYNSMFQPSVTSSSNPTGYVSPYSKLSYIQR